ncbi:hypothetical protein KBX00_28965, partial [Micromonospora sp. C95]|nr:hypothetical protein [Micromonospora sp. C95]
MLPGLRTTLGLTLSLTVAAAVAAPTPALAEPSPQLLLAAAVAPCVDGGPTAGDQAVADFVNPRLSAKMRNAVSAYTASCLRAVVTAVQKRGLPKRAAVIAITTAIVESSIRNISEEVDHDSLGIFQQRASWGSRSQRLNPEWATNAFLNKMISLYPNGAWQSAPIGEVCQRVQVSAFPERYQPQAGDAQILVDAVWRRPAAPSLGYDMGDGTMRIYRWTSDGNSFNRANDYNSGSFSLD